MDEVVSLVEGGGEGVLGVCDCVMLELFYFFGLCLFEFIGLCWYDFDLEGGEVCVLGKGSKMCIVLVGCYVVNVLCVLG